MNLPNALTLTRFFLIPAFIYVVFCFPGQAHGLIAGMAIFAFAGLTDLLDGYIARRYNLVTTWGKLMDPLADKLMLITVLISLTVKQLIPPFVVFVVIVKELLIIIGAAFLYKSRKIVVQANYFGKAASTIFFLAVVAVIFDFPYAYIIVSAALLATIIALVQYFCIAFLKNAQT
jgi:cardiolipin synthase